MADSVQLRINGRMIAVPGGTVLAAAIAAAGVTQFRRSVSGQPRTPVCGMGVCMGCAVLMKDEALEASLPALMTRLTRRGAA